MSNACNSRHNYLIQSEIRIAKEIQALKPEYTWTQCLLQAHEICRENGTEVGVELTEVDES